MTTRFLTNLDFCKEQITTILSNNDIITISQNDIEFLKIKKPITVKACVV